LKYKKYEYTSDVDNKNYSLDVGYERFLGPEMFFHPVKNKNEFFLKI